MRPTPNFPSDSPTGPSIQVTTDAVVASYIHTISDRHRREDRPADEATGQPPAE